jgi:hypothetical protein
MFGCGTKVRFMGRQKFQHRAQYGRIAHSGAQGIGIKPGQCQQPLGAGAIGQNEGVSRGLGFADNCGPRG